jgi:hypothetical protein
LLRQNAIADILSGKIEEAVCVKFQTLFKSMGDVERLLCRIHAKLEVKPTLFLACVDAFKNIALFLTELKGVIILFVCFFFYCV